MEKVMQSRKEELIHIVHEINRELLMDEAGWRMDKCADMIESYVASREAALVERIVGWMEANDMLIQSYGDWQDVAHTIREAARRKE